MLDRYSGSVKKMPDLRTVIRRRFFDIMDRERFDTRGGSGNKGEEKKE
jgi:hypothetical protein